MCRIHAATVLSISLMIGASSAQIVQIPQFVGTYQEGFETALAGRFDPCVQMDRVFSMTADLCTPGMAGAHVTSGWGFMCSISPHGGGRLFGSAQGWVEYAFDTSASRFGGFFGTNSGSSDIAIRFYDSARVLIATDMVTVTTTCTWTWNGWETLGSTGIKYIQIENAAFGGGFVDMDDMEYVEFVQPPTCMLTGPVSVITGDAPIQIDTASPSSPTVSIDFTFSTDAGATFATCTPAATSVLPNPAGGVAVGIADFIWDTVADNVGVIALQTGVIVMAEINDGVSPANGTCQTAPFDVDNSALCQGICGDCNLNATGPDILDALEAAQISAGLTIPTMAQLGCCDVNSSGTIEVIDALLIAQAAAGLPVTIACL